MWSEPLPELEQQDSLYQVLEVSILVGSFTSRRGKLPGISPE